MLKLAYIAAVLVALVLFIPMVLVVMVMEWYGYLRHGPAPSPFLPESERSFKAWAGTMERGRQIQQREDGEA